MNAAENAKRMMINGDHAIRTMGAAAIAVQAAHEAVATVAQYGSNKVLVAAMALEIAALEVVRLAADDLTAVLKVES